MHTFSYTMASSSSSSSKASKRKAAEISVVTSEEIQPQTTCSSSSTAAAIKADNQFPYNPKRSRNLYNPSEPFKLSRSKLENAIQCQVCSQLDLKYGLTPPPGYPFSLNNAVDELQKKDFNKYRKEQKAHPLFVENNIDAIPFEHADIAKWQNALSQGVKSKEIPGTNIFLQGGIDDVVIHQETKKLHVVDYKATSKKGEVSLDAPWQDSYKRQVEVYQYNFRDNGFDVSDTAYFPYSNANKEAESFDNKLDFKTSLLPYEGNTAWIQPTVVAVYQRLQSDIIPSDTQAQKLSAQCAMCLYFKRRTELMAKHSGK